MISFYGWKGCFNKQFSKFRIKKHSFNSQLIMRLTAKKKKMFQATSNPNVAVTSCKKLKTHHTSIPFCPDKP